jgi:hypothetical protein
VRVMKNKTERREREGERESEASGEDRRGK